MLVVALFVTAVNLVLWFVFFFLYRSKFSVNAVLKNIRQEVNALLAEIRHETDMSATIIEGRIQSLKELIDEADSRTMLSHEAQKKRLREEHVMHDLEMQRTKTREQDHLQKPAVLPLIASKDAANAPAAPAATAATAPSTETAAHDSAPVETTPPVQGTLFAAPAAVTQESPEIPPAAPAAPETKARVTLAAEQLKPKKSVKASVLELSGAGFSPDIIAEKLSVSMTEVQLIIDLYG